MNKVGHFRRDEVLSEMEILHTWYQSHYDYCDSYDYDYDHDYNCDYHHYYYYYYYYYYSYNFYQYYYYHYYYNKIRYIIEDMFVYKWNTKLYNYH